MSPRSTNPRELALSALCDRAGNVTAHLDRLLRERPVGPQQSALAWELALGVVRRRGSLDAVIAAFQTRRRRSLPPRVRQILRLGLYQLLFLDRVPAFAAVNETVSQVGRGHSGLRGFVNGLLRTVARSVSPLEEGPPPRCRDVLPVSAGSHRRFDRPVFPDPAADPAGYLAAAFSLPMELAGKWLKESAGPEVAVRRALHSVARPPLILRVNALRATVPEVLDRLAGQGIQAAAHNNGLSVAVTGLVSLMSVDVFVEGLVQPQDPTATAVVAAAPVEPGMRVLDLCAAPGTKTTHLAERMEDRGEILALDVSAEKLARVEANCRRMGVSIVRTMLAEKLGALDPASFDLVLVDVPCSNSGVLARRPEARWRFSRARLEALSRDQRRLLALGLEMVRPGGACVYATCSLEDEENAQVVRGALGRRRDYRLACRRSVEPAGLDAPTGWCDGGYLAVLRR